MIIQLICFVLQEIVQLFVSSYQELLGFSQKLFFFSINESLNSEFCFLLKVWKSMEDSFVALQRPFF